MNQITEGIDLCVLVKVDEKRMWKCLVSGKGQESRGGPELSPQTGQLLEFTTCFYEPYRDQSVGGSAQGKGSGLESSLVWFEKTVITQKGIHRLQSSLCERQCPSSRSRINSVKQREVLLLILQLLGCRAACCKSVSTRVSPYLNPLLGPHTTLLPKIGDK